MVKNIDDTKVNSDAPDHVGWAIWQCYASWKRRFNSEMREAGYPAFAEARGHLLMYVGPSGIGQADLVARTGLTKQAVQQALELLETEGLVERTPDKDDARRRRVVRTEAGRAAFAAASVVKQRIDNELATLLGENELTAFHVHLAAILDYLAKPANDDPHADQR